jgi:hypothetical protein
MLIALLLIIVIAMWSLTINLYSLFVPFSQNIHDVQSYYAAYYAALGSLERGLLVTRYQDPGFVGSGGWSNEDTFGPMSDGQSIHMGRLSLENTQAYWQIHSRTSRVPISGYNKVSSLFTDTQDIGYAPLYRWISPNFFLVVDTTSDPADYYRVDNMRSQYIWDEIIGDIALPSKVFDSFGGDPQGYLCDTDGVDTCDIDKDGIVNDIMVLWSLQGKYNGEYFRIIPRSALIDTGIDPRFDLHIRENIVNYAASNQDNLQFGSYFNPIAINTLATINTPRHVSLGPAGASISGKSFQELFQDISVNDLSLTLSLVGIPQSRWLQTYPFLLYRLEFDWPVADTHYRIESFGAVRDYGIRMQIDKPHTNQAGVGSFTILF